MKIDAAKKYVADKLGATVADIADEVASRGFSSPVNKS
jgi:hypothetical protein